MRTLILSDHVQARIDHLRAAQQARNQAEYEEAERRAAAQQQRYYLEYEAAKRQAADQLQRYKAQYEKARRQAADQQQRYDAEYEEAKRQAADQQQRYDAEYEEAKRAAEEQAREIAALRRAALTALLRVRITTGLRLLVQARREPPLQAPERRVARPPERKEAPTPRWTTPPVRPRKIAPRPLPTISYRLSPAAVDEIRRLEDSRTGEQRLPEALARLLGDQWTLMQGYRNNKGEADFILVGPHGVCAIEVKYLNGLVYAEADDDWRRNKYDSYGNLVEPGKPIQDGGGRSPSRQVREVAAELEHFLRRMLPDHHIGVRTAVVLTHARSQLGRIDAGVDTVTTLSDLEVRHLVDTRGAELSTDEVSDVVGLVQRDHSYHEDRLSGRRRRSRPATESSLQEHRPVDARPAAV